MQVTRRLGNVVYGRILTLPKGGADSANNYRRSAVRSLRQLRAGSPGSGELTKNDNRLLLPEQPFRILALLVGSPGALVTREHLRRELWRTDTFVDFEHSLNAAIKRLRPGAW